jgi:hypothetical protein
MILILCSISDRQPNDSTADGLVHFLLKAKFQDAEYVNAVFHRESRRMELIRRGQSNTRVIPMEDLKRSMRLACVSRLLAMMNTGDQLWTCELSDLADSAEDACSLYFSFLKKGIEMKFFDASYLDTDLLKLNSEPPADQKLLIQRIIQNYYDNPGGRPSGTKERSSDSGSTDSVKKKPHRA